MGSLRAARIPTGSESKGVVEDKKAIEEAKKAAEAEEREGFMLEAFKCSISGGTFSDPLIVLDGYTYNKEELERYYEGRQHQQLVKLSDGDIAEPEEYDVYRSPLTNINMDSPWALGNRALSNAIEEYKSEIIPQLRELRELKPALEKEHKKSVRLQTERDKERVRNAKLQAELDQVKARLALAHRAEHEAKEMPVSVLAHRASERDALNQSFLKAVKEQRYVEAFRFLIQQGASLHAVDERRNTALHLVAINIARGGNGMSFMRYLIEQGANKSALNESGRTPYQSCLISSTVGTLREEPLDLLNPLSSGSRRDFSAVARSIPATRPHVLRHPNLPLTRLVIEGQSLELSLTSRRPPNRLMESSSRTTRVSNSSVLSRSPYLSSVSAASSVSSSRATLFHTERRALSRQAAASNRLLDGAPAPARARAASPGPSAPQRITVFQSRSLQSESASRSISHNGAAQQPRRGR